MSRRLAPFALVALVAFALAIALGWFWPRLSAPPDRFQVALALLQAGRAGDAALLFEDKAWRGVAEYRAARYRQSLGLFFQEETITNLYNMGNAYARLHTWGAAKAAYRKVLQLDPAHGDAQHNLAVVLKAEARQKALLAASRTEKRLGRWRDGNREEAAEEPDANDKVAPGQNKKGELKKARSASTESGMADQAGTAADQSLSPDAAAGRSDERGTKDAARDLVGSGGSPGALRESEQAAEILLRRIKDNPARVLGARLRAIHRQREDGQP